MMKAAKWKLWIILFMFTLIASTMNAQDTTALSAQQQSLVRVSSLTAMGNQAKLKIELEKALETGLAINEIKEALVQLYAYCGFPRSLNAINTFKTVLDQRKAKGITDTVGKKIEIENNVPDKYEQGRKVLETLTQTPQSKPAPGFGEFVPRADAFLKEHLFADIFSSDVLSYQQRELVTISALAAMPGVEPQLQAHINMGKNTGITDGQLIQLSDLIEKNVDKTQADILRKIIGQPLSDVTDTGMMVRIAQIEIFPQYLKEYKSILEENAAMSVKMEPGVIAILPLFQQENPMQLRIVEVYASADAYRHHLQTPHFQYYKTTTLKMVKSLKLVEMNVVDKEILSLIFNKVHN